MSEEASNSGQAWLVTQAALAGAVQAALVPTLGQHLLHDLDSFLEATISKHVQLAAAKFEESQQDMLTQIKSLIQRDLKLKPLCKARYLDCCATPVASPADSGPSHDVKSTPGSQVSLPRTVTDISKIVTEHLFQSVGLIDHGDTENSGAQPETDEYSLCNSIDSMTSPIRKRRTEQEETQGHSIPEASAEKSVQYLKQGTCDDPHVKEDSINLSRCKLTPERHRHQVRCFSSPACPASSVPMDHWTELLPNTCIEMSNTKSWAQVSKDRKRHAGNVDAQCNKAKPIVGSHSCNHQART